MRRVNWCASLCLAVVVMTFAGCSGNSTVGLTFPAGTAMAIDQTQSVTINVVVANDTGQGVTWTCTGPACTALANVTALSVTFNASGATGTATITATSVKEPTISKSVVITVTALPSTTTTQAQVTADPATAGKTYTLNLTETGGSGALTWSATGLSGGLSINSSTGVISGTPAAKGTVNFTYTVTDSSAAGAKSATSGTLSITVNNPPPPAITTTQAMVTAGTAGTPYAFTFQATGTGTLTWAATGLPADGLTLNSTTGTVSGTPTTPSAIGITLTVSDAYGQASGATPFTITINPAPLQITTTTLPQGTNGTAYPNTNIAVTGGTTPYTWSVSAGSLPNGLTLNSSTGAISGTPSSATTSTFTIKVTDASSPQMSATQSYTISVALVITTASLPNGAVNTAYPTTNVTAVGGTPPYAWSVSSGALPAGLLLSPSTGAISGTVAANATSQTFTVQVQDSSATKQTATQSLTISIPLAIETTTLPNGAIGTSYNQTVAAGGGTMAYTFSLSAGTLPDGLLLNSSTGAISGTPKPDAQTETFTVKVADSSSPTQTATQTLTIFIPLKIETTTLPSGAPNVSYTASVAAGGGTQPYTWSTNPANLPPGLTLNASTGAITGTPTTIGTYSFSVTVTDASVPAQNASQPLSITIAQLAVTSTQPASATINSSYSFLETVSGGTPPYTYSLASGTLPSGLTLTASNSSGQITISGTPSNTAINESFSIKVTDSSLPTPQTATTSTLTILVNMVTVTTSPLQSGTVSISYSQQISMGGGQPPYTFALDAGSSPLPTGLSMNSSGLISGTPTVVGTTNNIIVDVNDSATPAQTQKPTFSITINPSDPCATAGTGGESLLNGQYAFMLKGFDNGQGAGETTPEPALAGGVLTFNGSGTITTGTLDMNLNSTGGVLSNTVTSGTYRIGASGTADQQRVCMDIITASGTQHYRAAINATGTIGHMIDFDAAGPYTAGELLKQDTTAFSTSKVTGNYAFLFSSVQNTATSSGGKTAIAGVLDLSTGTVSSGGQWDINDEGIVDDNATCTFSTCGPFSFSGGSYTIDATSGRGTITFSASMNGGSKTLNAILYVVSANQVLVLSSDDQAAGSDLVFGGTALKQSGPFSNSSLNGTSIFYLSAPNGTLSSPSGTTTNVGTAKTNGAGGITVYLWQNSSGTLQCGPNSPPSCSVSATYAASSSGRTLISVGGSGNHAPMLYLVSSNEGFMLGGGSGADTGFLQPQSSTSVSGTYAVGTIDPETPNSGVSDAIVTFSGGSVSGTNDNNSSGGPNTSAIPSTAVSVDSTGFGQVAASCTTNGGCQFIFYVISPKGAAGTDGSSTDPTVQTVDQ